MSSSALLDEVDEIQAKDKESKEKRWLKLCYDYADGKPPKPGTIAEIFQETGKTRHDLERCVVLIEERRSLQDDLDKVPALQAQYDKLMTELKGALKEREATENKLRELQQQISRLDFESSAMSRAISAATAAGHRINDAKFHAIDPAISENPYLDSLKAELKRQEEGLKTIQSLIQKKRAAYDEAPGEISKAELADLTPKKKEELQQSLALRAGANQDSANRLVDSEFATRKTIANLKREIAQLTASNGQSNGSANGADAVWIGQNLPRSRQIL